MSTRTVTTTLPGCCCPEEECDCPCCPDGYWTEYTFAISGIADNPPPDCECASYNGSWTVVYVGVCRWITEETIAGPCAVESPAWELSCDSGVWALSNQFMGVVYSDTIADFCEFGGDLLGGPAGVPCQNFSGPFTITVTPGGSWVPCP